MVTPARIALAASDASRVLPRNTPSWSANEKRTTSSFSFLMIFSTSTAAFACAPVHKPWRSTKLEDLRGRGFIAGPSVDVRPACGLALARLALLPVALPVLGRTDAVDGGGAGDARGLFRI